MFKRKTSRVRRATGKRLELRVTSMRIRWLQALGALGKLTKVLLVISLLGAGAWGAAIGIRRAFLENEDFRLRSIDLNVNRALDERRLVEIGKIDLDGSVFAVDVDGLRDKLAALPELAGAKVERQLPGTLVVRVRERVPVAWLECQAHGKRGRDPEHGVLIDSNRAVFSCPAGMRTEASGLPVIVLQRQETPAPAAGQVCVSPELDRCLRLLRKAQPAAAAGGWTVDRVEQANDWSLVVHTGDGVVATFGLGDHERQLRDFSAALAHAETRGYRMATINLIPNRNIPVTITQGGATREVPVEDAPKAIPVEEDSAKPLPPARVVTPNRRERDMRSLINRG